MNENGCSFDVKPYDQSGLIQPKNFVNINYTNQDFWSMKSRLVEYIKTNFGDLFNDFVESSLAIMLIENWAFLADTLSFKIDQIANEVFIDTVSEIDNAFRLCKLVGFTPQPPVAAKSLWKATMNSVLNSDMYIDTPISVAISTELGQRIIELYPADSDNNPLIGEQILIPAGQVSTTSVVGIEGKTINNSFTGTGEANQTYTLSTGPVIYNSVVVYVDGTKWQQVDYFTDSQPRQEYIVDFDSSYNAYVIFGNSLAGMIPSVGSNINIQFRVGGGIIGNIVTGSANIQRNYDAPGTGLRVSVDFRNYTMGEFGYDGDKIEDIKRKLPLYLQTQNRAVTGNDYKILTEQFATEYNGLTGKANAVLRNYGCAANVVDIYVLVLSGTNDLQEPNNQFKVELYTYLNNLKMLTDYICIKDGFILESDVVIDIIMDKFYRKFEEEYRTKVLSRVNTFFSLNNWDYGKSLKNIDLIKQLSDIKEINSFEINFTTNDPDNSGENVYAKYYEIIRPSNIDVNFTYE